MNDQPLRRPDDNGEGARSAQVGAIDFASHNDRTMFMAADQRWGVKPSFKAKAVRALEYALSLAVAQDDHRAITGCVRCLAHIEQQNQSDEHLKLNLAAKGSPIDDLSIRVVYESQAHERLGSDDDSGPGATNSDHAIDNAYSTTSAAHALPEAETDEQTVDPDRRRTGCE